MHDHIYIYLIVGINVVCQILLIRRQKMPDNRKWLFCSLAIAIPLVLMVSMRLLIAAGLLHAKLADQTSAERLITQIASIMLLAGPWLTSIAAVLFNINRRLQPQEPATT